MLRSHRASSHRFGSFIRIALVTTVGLIAGCGGDDDGPTGPSGGGGGGGMTTTFTGVLANGTENGSLIVTINTTNLAAPVPQAAARQDRGQRSALATITASGTWKPIGGSQVTFTGSYDDQTDSLALSNSTAGYYLAGVYDSSGTFDAIVGQYTGPNGIGAFGCITGITSPVGYCGTFTSNVSSNTGNVDVLIAGGEVGGIAFPVSGEPFAFEGTIETTGTMRDITAGNSEPDYNLTITGTLDTTTNTITGTWTYEDLTIPATDTGPWSASPCP